MRGAITAEDLEASFHTETDGSTDTDTEPSRAPLRPAPGPGPRLPPGFDGGAGRGGEQQQSVLGVQSLANLAAQPPGTPLLLPRFPGPGPVSPFIPGPGLPLTPGPGLRDQGQPPLWPGPGFLAGPGPLLAPGPGPELLHNPWLHFLDPRLPPPAAPGSNPLPIPAAKSKPNSPDLLLDEGSPITPPNLHNFDFED